MNKVSQLSASRNLLPKEPSKMAVQFTLESQEGNRC